MIKYHLVIGWCYEYHHVIGWCYEYHHVIGWCFEYHHVIGWHDRILLPFDKYFLCADCSTISSTISEESAPHSVLDHCTLNIICKLKFIRTFYLGANNALCPISGHVRL